jgi:hypothetical protein
LSSAPFAQPLVQALLSHKDVDTDMGVTSQDLPEKKPWLDASDAMSILEGKYESMKSLFAAVDWEMHLK